MSRTGRVPLRSRYLHLSVIAIYNGSP